jgi:hypothetical protein
MKMKNFKLYTLILLFIFILFTQVNAQNILSTAVLDTIPPATPVNVNGFGYEKHIDIDWWENSEPDLAGYNVYRRVGNEFYFYTAVPKDKSYLYLYLDNIGITNYFKVSAYDLTGNESALSDSVECTTHSMTDEEFLDMVQRATFRYFYDYGVMALLVGIERGFISREQGITRMLKILNFLNTDADRFHGAFSHWLNGTTGDVIPFSQYDNGGDLVETSFMIQGLLTARQYFDLSTSEEIEIRNLITQRMDMVSAGII